jgi:aminopeptidase N
MPPAEITRAETAERARLLSVDSYDVSLDLTGGGEVFASTSVVRFGCAEPGASSYADLIAADVRQVTLNGSALDPAAVYGGGRITLPGLAARNELRVVADCRYSSTGAGLHRTVDSADGKVYLYTNFEPADARRVFANFEQPDLKAKFAFHVTAPAHWTVLSNQPAPEPAPVTPAAPDGEPAAVWHFPPTPRISTYVTAVAAGEYHLVRESHTTPGGQVIPLGLGCRASLAAHLDPAEIFQVTRQGLDFYTALFQTPYPFAKYDQVFVPEFPGAMENPGCVTLGEQFLFRSRVTDTMYQVRAEVILHEMAHMWFGDLVTMRWWDDLWLNESFAECCALLASAEATRFTGAWTTFSGGRKNWGYMQDQLPSAHPVAANAPTLTEAATNFDGISYAKGASVLKQLVAYVGRDAFFTGVRAYFAEHSFGNATLADLLRALGQSSGSRLSDWSKAWLETAGPNTLRPEFETGPGGELTWFAVLQEAPERHPVLRPHRIAIGLYNRVDDAPGADGEPGALLRTQRVEVDVSGARTPVPELAGMPQPDLILLNDDDLGYALIRFDPRSLATLTSSIGAFADSLARTVCWSAVIDMVQQAELSLPAFTAMLCTGMGAEQSVSLLQTLHYVAAQAITRFADPQWVPRGKQQLAAAAEDLLRAAEPGSDHQLAWAQLLGWTATTTGQLDLLAGLLDGSIVLPGLGVDTELRWALLQRLCAADRASDAEIDAEAERDPTDAGRRHAVACRAAVPDAAHKAAAWALLAGRQDLGVETLAEVASAFAQPEHAHLLAPYADRYFEALPDVWAARDEGGPGSFRLAFGQLLFPYPLASPELLAQIDAFLSGAARSQDQARVVTEGRDVVERALRSRALPDWP